MTEFRRAYWVEESTVGVQHWLVYGDSIREIRADWPNVEKEAIDNQTEPHGLRSVKRAPEEDR